MHEEAGFGTRAIHAGQQPDPTTGAIMTPVYQTSTYAQESPGVLKGRYDYSRSANPTRTALEANLAALEGGAHGLCFSSGCAALSAILHLLEAGEHVLLSDDVYGGTFRLLEEVFRPLGIVSTRADLTDLDAAAAAFGDHTRLVWLETPSNPMLKVIDIEAMAALAKDRGALLAVDNTFATRFLQAPLALGADLVGHSSTKYLGGHSDVVGGAVVTNDGELAERLESRSDVTRVIYPGLPSHPGHEIAARQMRDFGGMVTAVLEGGLERARRFLERVTLFTLGESLGGVESLIEHPAIMTHASIPADKWAEIGIEDGLVRLSVGIEDVTDLLEDLEQALAPIPPSP